MKKAVFEGLVYDTDDRPMEVRYIGNEAFYVLDDHGFLRHIPSEEVDRQIWDAFGHQIEGHEDLLSQKAAEMIGQDDIFTVALIRQQLQNKEIQFEQLTNSGIPEEARSYLNMIGFKIVVDYHGEVVEIHQPSFSAGGDEEEDE